MNLEKLFKEQKLILWLIFIGLMLILTAKLGIYQPVLGVVQRVSIPLQIGFAASSQTMGNTFSAFADIANLRTRNSDLSQELAALKVENTKLKKLETENIQLREQLAAPSEGLLSVAVAKRVGFGGLGSKSILLIDKGSSDSVKKGDLAVFKNILLGEVIEVTPKLTSIRLLSDPSTRVPVTTASGTEGLLRGLFGSEMEISDVLQEDGLQKGELVFASGKNGFPTGLVVGQINKVKKIEREFFKSATVDQLLEVKNLDLIFIVRNK